MRDHTAHRVAQQVEAGERERIDERSHVGDELIERVARGVAGVRALAAPPMIEGDHLPLAGEGLDDVGPVEGTAGETVREDEGKPVPRPKCAR